jgi:NitT/TauT family transport system permease protein
VVAEFVAGTGGTGAGLAYQILQAGFQLNIPRMFAALLLISLTGVLLFLLMAGCPSWALGGWHESEAVHETEACTPTPHTPARPSHERTTCSSAARPHL